MRQELNLSEVDFINVDAREAEYADGTVFFLYTPFEGKMLLEVLGRLKEEAQRADDWRLHVRAVHSGGLPSGLVKERGPEGLSHKQIGCLQKRSR